MKCLGNGERNERKINIEADTERQLFVHFKIAKYDLVDTLSPEYFHHSIEVIKQMVRLYRFGCDVFLIIIIIVSVMITNYQTLKVFDPIRIIVHFVVLYMERHPRKIYHVPYPV